MCRRRSRAAALLVAAIAAVGGPGAALETERAAVSPLAAASKLLHGGAFEDRSTEEVYREIGRQGELEVTFGSDLHQAQVSLLLDGMSVEQALSLVARLAWHFVVPLTERSILVLPDTP